MLPIELNRSQEHCYGEGALCVTKRKVGLKANASDRISQHFVTRGIRGWEPLHQGFRSQELLDVVKCEIRDVGPEFIELACAAMLGFVEVDSLGNDRGGTLKRTEQLLTLGQLKPVYLQNVKTQKVKWRHSRR